MTESPDSTVEGPSKAAQIREFLEEYAFEPKAAHMVGLCNECNQEVWIDTALRPFGPAKSCEEHEPLCRLQFESNH